MHIPFPYHRDRLNDKRVACMFEQIRSSTPLIIYLRTDDKRYTSTSSHCSLIPSRGNLKAGITQHFSPKWPKRRCICRGHPEGRSANGQFVRRAVCRTDAVGVWNASNAKKCSPTTTDKRPGQTRCISSTCMRLSGESSILPS